MAGLCLNSWGTSVSGPTYVSRRIRSYSSTTRRIAPPTRRPRSLATQPTRATSMAEWTRSFCHCAETILCPCLPILGLTCRNMGLASCSAWSPRSFAIWRSPCWSKYIYIYRVMYVSNDVVLPNLQLKMNHDISWQFQHSYDVLKWLDMYHHICGIKMSLFNLICLNMFCLELSLYVL